MSIVEAVKNLADFRGVWKHQSTTSYLFRGIYRGLRRCVDRAGLMSNGSSRLRPQTRPTLPQITTSKDVSKYTLGKSVEPTNMVELRDLIASCCLSEFDEAIVRMREEDYTLREIASALALSFDTTRRMYRAIRDRFEEKYRN